MEGKKRPILIALIGLVTLLVAVLILATAALALLSDILVDIVDIPGIDLIGFVGYGGFIAGIIILIIGIAIWRGWAIAWYVAVIIYGLAVIVTIATMALILTGGEVAIIALVPLAVSLLISLLILYYLFRPKVKEFFGI